ncbi:MAG: choice-of-anchor D domain-containing protein [Alphaproteobacteria bacterium]|nr:choice-of-anchor D domain-containing protein [Alphaproteobacteria bacterium]
MLFGLVGMLVCNGGGVEPPRFDTGDFIDEPIRDTAAPDECSPWMDVEPDELDFGVVVGEVEPLEVTVYNGGDCELALLAVELWEDADGAFSLAPPEEPLVPPGDHTTFSVAFVAEAPGVYEAQLLIDSNDPYLPQQLVTLRAERVGETALMALEPSSLDFGEVPLGCAVEMSAEVVNAGGGPLTLSQLEVFDAGEAFSLVEPLPSEVAAQGSALLTLRYAPTAAVEDTAYLLVAGDGQPGEGLVSLRGLGLAGAEALFEALGDGQTARFELPSVPVPETLEVELDGVRQSSGWGFDALENAVEFTEAPATDVVIDVRYVELGDCE